MQLMDIDPAIQQGALRCLKVFKLQFLLPYLDRLLRLADNKTLREELTAFPLAIMWVGECCHVLQRDALLACTGWQRSLPARWDYPLT